VTATREEAFDQALEAAPLIAILRGLTPTEAIAVGEALYAAGVRLAEVPLNSPDPYESIALLCQHFQGRMLIGAGTVLRTDEVERLASIGCAFVVSPNTDAGVISATLAAGMVPLPGFSTPSEAFAALAAGARHLKAFPAHGAQQRLAALSAVLPPQARLIAVGGVQTADLAGLGKAGVCAVGVGSDLYRPGHAPAQVQARAQAWLSAMVALHAPAAQLVCNPRTMVGESPMVVGEQVLWVDPTRPCLLSWDGRECHEVRLPEPVWALGISRGELVGNGEPCFVRLSRAGEVERGPAIAMAPGCRLNDLVIDSRGGLWGGSMHRGLLAGKGALFHAPAFDQPARVVAEGLGVANGMAFSQDEKTLFVIDTLARTLLAYPADTLGGRLGEPRVVTDFLGVPGKPDGMALSPAGTLWVAMWGGEAVVELADNGAVLRSVPVPAHHVGSLCFDPAGGMFITTARARLTPEALERWPGSGGLFRVAPSR